MANPILTVGANQCQSPVYLPPVPADRAELVAILDETAGLFAVVQIGAGQRVLPVEAEHLERFTAFADFIRSQTGLETRPPRRRWRDVVARAIERGAIA